MFSLQLRMAILLAVLFAIIYAVIVMIGTAAGVYNYYFYIILSFAMMLIQYLIGPKIVEWTMRVRYVERHEAAKIYAMVEGLAQQANMPVPRVCISEMAIPNAFAFGRSISDGRVCVTRGILQLLNDEELRAVLGHELSHIKNRDVLVITLLSVIPMIMYRIAWHTMFYGSGRRNQREGDPTALIGIAAFLFYFITNLLVLYASRIREYFADKGSIALGNPPAQLASALYKLVYGSARLPQEQLKEAEGLKAFFLNDPSQAVSEFNDLKRLDLDKNGTIDSGELLRLSDKKVRLQIGDRLMELMSTHPNMLKRIKRLSEIGY